MVPTRRQELKELKDLIGTSWYVLKIRNTKIHNDADKCTVYTTL